MPKDDIVYLGHMLDMTRKVVARVAAKSRDDFETDEDLRLVVAHLVQIIGEAAAQVSPPMRQAHPEIPWNQITGIRHHIVHGYMSVDWGILWRVATCDLPPLGEALEQIVPPDEP
jgi:uncharacterized protein with HEPN domain